MQGVEGSDVHRHAHSTAHAEAGDGGEWGDGWNEQGSGWSPSSCGSSWHSNSSSCSWSTGLGDTPAVELPAAINLARAAAPVWSALEPGDLTAFQQAVPKLAIHMDSLLLQYILAVAKYPTVVHMLAEQFAKLPKKITPQNLLSACHKVFKGAHESNKDPVLRCVARQSGQVMMTLRSLSLYTNRVWPHF